MPRPPIGQQEEILEIFASPQGTEVPYRRGWYLGGSAGFGYDKVVAKHGITNNAVVGAVVRSPQRIRLEGRFWVHEKEAILFRFFGESESVTVRVVINYTGWEGRGRHGVVTAYCFGYDGLCPEWINSAFAID